jgi:hypothetical protein
MSVAEYEQIQVIWLSSSLLIVICNSSHFALIYPDIRYDTFLSTSILSVNLLDRHFLLPHHITMSPHHTSQGGRTSPQTSSTSLNSPNMSFLSSINHFIEFIWIMKSTNTLPCRSRRNVAKDAQAAPASSSLPSWHCSPSKKDEQGGKVAITPSVPSITLAAVNAPNAAAVAAANPRRKLACPLAPTADVSAPVSSTLPAGVAAFPAANIMPTAALVPTAKFARPKAVAADVSVATATAYSMLDVTIADDDAEMGVQTVKALSVTADFATAEVVATDAPVATAAASSASAVAVDLAAAVASAAAVAAPAVASDGKKGWVVIFCMSSYIAWIHILDKFIYTTLHCLCWRATAIIR